jgi:hypothetical protein
MVDHKEDSLVVLLDTTHSHIRITISGERLQNNDMVERSPISAVQRKPLPTLQGYVEDFDELRTKLADLSSILLEVWDLPINRSQSYIS